MSAVPGGPIGGMVAARTILVPDLQRFESSNPATIASDWFASFNRVARHLPEIATRAVVYGGGERQSRSDAEVAPLTDLGEVLERMDGWNES